MSEEKRYINEVNSNDSGNDVYENAFDAVPEDKKKSLISLIFVLAGYPIALSNFVIGGNVGAGLTFSKAALALLVGNGVLMAIVLLTGVLAYKTGMSTAFMSRRAFGKSGSNIFSILLALSAVTWISINGDVFARLIVETFSFWKIGVPITAIIVILLWTQSAIRGYKGLEFISFLGVPAALIMSGAGVIAVAKATNNFAELANYVPETPMTFTAATAAIVGGWVFGAVITPDVLRFAKKMSHVFIAGGIAFAIGCFGLQFAGAAVSIATGYADFTMAMSALGLSGVAFVAAIFCLWTTQDNNMYAASLAVQNVIEGTKKKGKVTHKQIVICMAVIACVLAAMGIYAKILPIVKFLSLLIPPVPGLIAAEEFFVKNSKENVGLNSVAIIAWLIAGVASYLSLKYNFFITPVIGLLTSTIAYTLLSKLTNK